MYSKILNLTTEYFLLENIFYITRGSDIKTRYYKTSTQIHYYKI